MMMSVIRRRLLSSHHPLLLFLRAFSTAGGGGGGESSCFAVDYYLITECGLPPEKAARAAKSLAHLKSSTQPDSVLRFLRLRGFSAAQIAQIVAKYPRFLCSSVDRSLAPKLLSIRDLGFSDDELVRFVSGNPFALKLRDPLSRLRFWRSFLAASNDTLIKTFARDLSLLTTNLHRRVLPNLALLRECGVSDRRIATLVRTTPRFISMPFPSLARLVRRTEDLGVPRGSGMFVHLLRCLSNISLDTLAEKMQTFRSFGWSEAELASAVQKAPLLLKISRRNAADTMEFLTKEAGCTPAYVAARPILLAFSLERRLIPRHAVLQLLRLKDLARPELFSPMVMTDEQFVAKFILPNEESVPGLLEAYTAACLGKAPEFSKM